MELEYQNSQIRSVATEIPESDRWYVKVSISGLADGNVRSFDGPSEGFSSKERAEAWGITFGKQKVDEG
jgi:hypothetical protein